MPFGDSVKKKSGMSSRYVIATKSKPEDFHDPGMVCGTSVPYEAYGSCKSMLALLTSLAVSLCSSLLTPTIFVTTHSNFCHVIKHEKGKVRIL